MAADVPTIVATSGGYREHDSEDRRRPLVHRLVADGTLGTTHCTDDGVGMLYRGTEFVEAVSELAGKGAYIVRCEGDGASEERLETRLLSVDGRTHG